MMRRIRAVTRRGDLGASLVFVLVADEELAGTTTTAATISEAVRAWKGATGAAAGEGSACVLVGPEGGWSDAERRAFEEVEGRGGLMRIGLGPLVLRAETAALVATAVLANLGWRSA